MSHTAETIAQNADVLRREVVEFVSGLAPADLAAACDDEAGDTVEHVLTHMQDGIPQVLAWLAQPASPPTAGRRFLARVLPRVPGHGHRHGDGHSHGHGQDHGQGQERAHGHDHGPDHAPDHGSAAQSPSGSRPDRLAADLDASLSAAVRLLGQLSDADLDRVPPPAPGLGDGTLPVRQIVGGMLEHQRDHVRAMERAVRASRAVRGPRP